MCQTVFLVGGTGNGRREKIYCGWECRSKAKINSNGAISLPLQDSVAAYIAGLVDADGHVGLYAHQAKAEARKVWRPHLSVVNTYLPVLHWLRETTGVGSVNVQHKETATRKESFNWLCTSGAAVSVLQQLLPHMHVKQERAELLVEFWKKAQDPAMKAETGWQDEYRTQMLALNKRGPGMVAN